MFLWGSNGYPAPFEKVYLQGLHPRQAASGSSHIVVLLRNGSVVTWGSEQLGQIGRPSSTGFTLEPAVLNLTGDFIRQLAVGSDSTIVISGAAPAPSLCPCLSGWFSYWRSEVPFKSTCTSEQNQCGDGSCCGQDETCCASVSDADKNSVRFYRAIDAKPFANVSSSYYCISSKDAQCCDIETPFACPNSYKCISDSKPPRCEPTSKKVELTAEEKLENSVEVIKKKAFSTVPGFIIGENGVCGARKETCPDETCCQKGQTCCGKDGGFGCCPHSNGVCCGGGCCQEGFVCDDEKNTCVKESVKVQQEKIVGRCGNGKKACPDSSCCSDESTCCVLSDGYFGCCPHTNGICCVDGAGCCPESHTCDVAKGECVRQTIVDFGADKGKTVETRIPLKSTPRNTAQRSEASSITCESGEICQYPGSCCSRGNGGFGCCDFINGTCCAGGFGCCPNSYECDVSGSSCKSLISTGSQPVPMKFVRDAKPPAPGAQAQKDKAKDICQGKPKCDDDTCCPLGATCCSGISGTFCCDKKDATCCAFGGCCNGGDSCDAETNSCKDKSGRTYGLLASQKPTDPPPPSGPATNANAGVSNPDKCFADERLCPDGFCCPRSSTCCNKGYGQYGCCPNTAAVCCDGGGCCPTGSTCDAAANSCVSQTKELTPIIKEDLPHPPEAKYDVEECWDDEQTCSGDAGCCLQSETCCLTITEEGPMSSCCPFENGVCCGNGAGCCPSLTECNLQLGTCVNAAGENVHDLAEVKGSVTHPIGALAETDCPDGSVCGAFDTCCSLGFDESWGEEVFACCPFENAICCKDFEGCCPSGYECDAQSKGCVGGERTIPSGNNAPTEPPPTYVCALPKTQCPNGKCCEETEHCVEIESGNFKCMERGYAYCNNSYACPVGLYCEERNSKVVCSEVQDNDEKVKEALLRQYWGENPAAACHSILLQQEQEEKSFSPAVEVHKATVQTWFPKKLVMKSPAIKLQNTSLPTVLAAKVCQHLKVVNSTAVRDFCFLANTNGHYIIKDRPRVKELIDEYTRRMCYYQSCEGPKGSKYEFVAEELNPCPCRPEPPKPKNNTDVSAGATNEEAIINVVASAEQQGNSNTVSNNNATDVSIPVVEEKKITTIRTETSGAVPLILETPVDDPAVFQLVPPNKDDMKASPELDLYPNVGDVDMVNAHRPETFMGKEGGCEEDVAESAVDLDGETAVQMDAKAENRAPSDISVAQMNLQVNSRTNLMPDTP
jgi:progranulin